MNTAAAPDTAAGDAVMMPMRSDKDEVFLTQKAGKLAQLDRKEPTNRSSGDLDAMMKRNEGKMLQSTRLLQKQKELASVQELLDTKRQEYNRRMDACRKRRQILKEKLDQLQDRKNKFDKFIKENDQKKQRAIVKAQTERKLSEQKEAEMHAIQTQYQELQETNERVKKLIKKYGVYESYLQTAVGILPANFIEYNEPNVQDIIMRFKTFAETKNDLKHLTHQYAEEIEEKQSRIKAMESNHTEQMMLLNAKLSDSQKKLEKMKASSLKLEQKTEESVKVSKEKMKLLGEARLAIENLYVKVTVPASYWSHAAHNTAAHGLNPANTTNIIEQDKNLGGGGNGGVGGSKGANGARVLQQDVRRILLQKVQFIQGRTVDYFEVYETAQQLLAKEKQKKVEVKKAVTKKQRADEGVNGSRTGLAVDDLKRTTSGTLRRINTTNASKEGLARKSTEASTATIDE